MSEPDRTIQRDSELWTIHRVHHSQQEEADLDFWLEQMTPEQRVMAVYECTESCLKAKDEHGNQPFRRIYRRVKRQGAEKKRKSPFMIFRISDKPD